MSSDPPPEAGRGNPPPESRFKKGQSGNPRGRPRKQVQLPPFESVLGQMVTVTDEDGSSRSVRLEEAFLQRLVRRGLKDDLSTSLYALNLIESLRGIDSSDSEDNNVYVTINNFLFSVNDAMLPLKMAQKLNKDGLSPRILMEPWLVQKALAPFGDRELTAEEQREIWSATRTPNKVQWPPWWTERRGTGRRRPKAPLVDDEGFHPPCVIPRRADSSAKRSR